MRKRKSCLTLFAGLLFFIQCGQNRDRIDRSLEGGVEIVVNHLEPYNIGDKSTPTLKEAFKIDTERDDISRLGLGEILGFDVDSEGDVYGLRNVKGAGNFVYKFDKSGKFIKSFGSRGEGPGELQQPNYLYLDAQENIVIVDLGKHPLNKFGKDGSFLGAPDIARNAGKAAAGPGAGTLVLENTINPEDGRFQFALKLLNSDLKDAAILDQYGFKFEREKMRVMEPVFCWCTSKDSVFVSNEDRGYEIWVFDSAGKLVRKIRKEYTKVAVTEGDKKEILNRLPPSMRSAAYFPEFYPAIRGIAAGEDGTLLVSTYEKGSGPGEFIFDIFNPEGAFIARKSLNAHVWENHLWARLKGDKFYCLRQKNSGYWEILASEIKWE